MSIDRTSRRNAPVIFCTMADHDENRITYVQAFENPKPIQEQVEALSEWYSQSGLTEICASTNDLADITRKWHDQGSYDMSSNDYYAIQTLSAHIPQDAGPVWVVWA